MDRWINHRAFPRYIVIGTILALLAVGLGGFTVLTTYIAMQRESEQRLQVIVPATRNLNNAYRYFIDQETAMRGYVITGQRVFLEPYNEAVVRLPYHLSQLDNLLKKVPDGDGLLSRVVDEHQTWVRDVAEVEIARLNQGDKAGAVALIASGAGKEQFDRLRASVELLESHLNTQRELSDRRLAALEERLITLLVATLIGLTVFILLGARMLRRRVVAPLTSEIEEQAGLIDLSQDAIVTRDVEGPITFWSRGAETLYGYTKEEAVGQVMRDLLQTKLPEPKPVMQERFFRDGFWTGLLTHTTKSGEEVMVASRWVLRRDEHGNPASIFEVNTNVSDRALSALKSATEAQFRQDRQLIPNERRQRPRLGELKEAMVHNDITAHYQPIVRLHDHQIVGLEALMRWNHPIRGVVGPDEFLSEVMQNNLMDAMGQMVLERALEDISAWSDEGLFVSVNLESRQLLSSGLPQRLRNMIEGTKIDPARIWLEIPESLYADHFNAAIQRVEELRDIGCTIALDDFGTGTASLDWLARAPVDVLKVDRRFVKGIGRSASDEAVLRAVAGLAKELGLVLVSEGIETPVQRDKLLELGYDFGQGFLFSKAVEQDDLLKAVLPASFLREDLVTGK